MNKLLKIFAFSFSFLFLACAKDSLKLVENINQRPAALYSVFSKVQSKANTISSKATNYLSSNLLSSTNSLIPNSFFSSFELFSDEITALTVTKDGLHAFIGSDKGSVYLASINKLESKNMQAVSANNLDLEQLLKSKRPILALSVSSDGNFLAISQFSIIVVYDLKKREIVNKMTRVPGRIISLAWDKRTELLAFGCSSGETYVWQIQGTPESGKDSLLALEKYGDASGSPIEKVFFHATSRVLITSAKNNSVTFWRLLRTERELKLRDEDAEVDSKNVGSKKAELPRLSANLEEIVAVDDFSKLLVLTADGIISSFKIRGLDKISEINVGKENAFSFKSLKVVSDRTSSLLVLAGRTQKIRIDCGFSGNQKNDLENSLSLSNKTSENLYESPVFQEPMNEIYLAENSSVLWITQKNGRLITFDLQDLYKIPDFNKKIAECSSY